MHQLIARAPNRADPIRGYVDSAPARTARASDRGYNHETDGDQAHAAGWSRNDRAYVLVNEIHANLQELRMHYHYAAMNKLPARPPGGWQGEKSAEKDPTD